MNCKNCDLPIDTGCVHNQCAHAHAQGFCSQKCQADYLAIRAYELNKAEERWNHEKKRLG